MNKHLAKYALFLLLAGVAHAQPVLIAHGCARASTITLNTTGANWASITASYYSTAGTVSSSGTGTWQAVGSNNPVVNVNNGYQKTFFVEGYTGTASDVFALAGFDFADICVTAFSGMAASGTLGPNNSNPNGSGASASSVQAGSITTFAGSWMVLAVEEDSTPASVKTIGSGYAITDQLSFSSSPFSYGLALAWNTIAASTATNPAWGLSPSTPPSAAIYAFRVAGLTAGVTSQTGQTATSISLSATDAVLGTSPYTYQWYRSTSSGFTPGGGNILSGKTSRTLTDTGLTSGVTYYYVISYTDQVPNTVYATQFAATPAVLAPGSISETGYTATTANLAATDASGGTTPYTYQWYRSTASGFTPGGGNIRSGATSLTINDTGLTTGTTYYYVLGYTDAASALVYAAQFAVTPVAGTQIYLAPGNGGTSNVLVPQVVTGATNATPVVLTTQYAHGFSGSCTTGVASSSPANVCYCAPEGVPQGTGASYANGTRECVPISVAGDSSGAFHLALYDLSGNPVPPTGVWYVGNTIYANINATLQWVAPLTQYTIPSNAGMIGFMSLDLQRRIALTTQDGLVGPSSGGLVVTGGSAGSCASVACVVHVNTTYDPTATQIPTAPGNFFSIHGTHTPLDTCGSGGTADCPWTVGAATSSGWTSTPFTAAGVTTGDYTSTLSTCGPPATANDTGYPNGHLSCTTVSQDAYTGNLPWTRLVNLTSGMDSGTAWQTWFDGGSEPVDPSGGLMGLYANAGIRFMVDPTDTGWLNVIIYALNHDYRIGGVGYVVNQTVQNSNQNFLYTGENDGLNIMYQVATNPQYWTASEQNAFMARTYNDCDDPAAAACVTTNQDAGHVANHLWQLSSGLLAVGTNDGTHAQLPSSDANYGSTTAYVGAELVLSNGGGGNNWDGYTTALITSHSSGGVLTLSNLSGTAPALDNIATATYQSGLTCMSGTTGQNMNLYSGNATFLITETGNGTFMSGTPMVVTYGGSGFGSAPTTAVVEPYSGGAGGDYCTGTATITSTLGTPYAIYDSATLNNTTAGANAIATFAFSTLAGTINVGDAIMPGYNYWPTGDSGHIASYQSYVSAVGPGGSACGTLTAQQLCVINGGAVQSGPGLVWRIIQWTAGDVGRLWASKHINTTGAGAITSIYKTAYTNYGNVGGFIVPSDSEGNGGGVQQMSWPNLDLAVAPSGDSRAVRDLALRQPYIFNYGLSTMIGYVGGGRCLDGSGYCADQDELTVETAMWPYSQTPLSPSFPNLRVGSWWQDWGTWLLYETLPDNQGNSACLMPWGGGGGPGPTQYCWAYRSSIFAGWGLDPSVQYAPTSNQAGWLHYFADHSVPGGSVWGIAQDASQWMTFMHSDPRVAEIDYHGIPHQRLFKPTSSVVQSLTGRPNTDIGVAGYVISRGGDGWTSKTDSLIQFDSSTPHSIGGAYDSVRVGMHAIYKTGYLLGGDAGNGGWNVNTSIDDDTIAFNNGGYNQFCGHDGNCQAYTTVDRFASANAGSYGQQFGDSASRYGSWCSNTTSEYNQSSLGLSLSYTYVCGVHSKNSAAGHDEFLHEFHEAALASGSAPIAWHLHYPANGGIRASGDYNPTSGTVMSGGVITSQQMAPCTSSPPVSGPFKYCVDTGGLMWHCSLGAGNCTSQSQWNLLLYGDVDIFATACSATPPVAPGSSGAYCRDGSNKIWQYGSSWVQQTPQTYGTSGLKTAVFSPGTITVQDDCTLLGGNGQCVPPSNANVTASGTGVTNTGNGDFTMLSPGETVTITRAKCSPCVVASVVSGALTLTTTATYSGNVNVSGTGVTWVSGDNFTNLAANDAFVSGPAGCGYCIIASVNSSTSLTLAASATTASGAAYTSALVTSYSAAGTYSGGQGNTHRYTVAGGASVGASVPKLETCTVHKIMANAADTTFSAVSVTPDTNWFGCAATGTNSTSAALKFKGTGTTASMTPFVLTSSLPVDMTFVGLTPGNYSVTVGGVSTAGSPYTVSAGDTTLYANAAAGGTVAVTLGAPTLTITTTSPLPGGTVGTPYSQTLATANGTGSVTWSVSAGTICGGLTLGGSTGIISGTPTTVQTCSFTAQAIDQLPTTTSQVFSITVGASGAPAAGTKVGGAKVNAIIH